MTLFTSKVKFNQTHPKITEICKLFITHAITFCTSLNHDEQKMKTMRLQYSDPVALGNVVQNKEQQYICFDYHYLTINNNKAKDKEADRIT